MIINIFFSISSFPANDVMSVPQQKKRSDILGVKKQIVNNFMELNNSYI